MKSATSVVIAVAMMIAGCRGGDKPGAIESAYEALGQIDDAARGMPERVRAALVEIAYVDLFMSPSMRRGAELSDRELEVRFKAARMVAQYVDGERFVRELATQLAELERRRLATDVHYEQMYGAYVQARMFADARALAMRHPGPGLEALPVIREAAGLVAGKPTELVVDPHDRVLTRQAVDLEAPAQIVVIGHPDCHFTAAAADAIQADPLLRGVFHAHAKWLAPPMTKFLIDDVQQWNRERPELPLSLVFTRDEWPALAHWGLPTFYFFRHGAVVATVRGWPKAGRRDELIASARAIGLL